MFQQIFIDTALQFSGNQNLADQLWAGIAKNYSRKNRYYHNLQHLDHLLQALLPVKDLIKDWQIIVFAIAYHDIVYNTLKHNNELKSAEEAGKQLKLLQLPVTDIEKCKAVILATQGHQTSEINDINLFTDADLSILGAAPSVYQLYTNNIRAEYHSYPDFLYKPGRAKVLQHFLSMDRIFKSTCFFDQYEAQARENIQCELEKLS